MKLDRFLYSYNGNKFNETTKMKKKTNLNINEYNIIAEPFCGIFGFSRCMFNEDFEGEIWLNDVDPLLIKALTMLKDEPEKVFNIIDEALTKYNELGDVYATSKKLDKQINEKDLFESYILKLVFGFCGYLLNFKKSNKIKNYKEKLNEHTLFFDKVKFFNLDYNDFIRLLPNNNKTLIYLDPPYLDTCNRDYIKYCEVSKDNTIIYIELLELLETSNTHIIITVNGNALMKYVYKNYVLYEENKTYQHQKKNKTTHITCSNFLKLKDV